MLLIFTANMHGLYKKGTKIANAFQKFLNEADCKPNQKGSEFYNRSMKSWPEKNDIQMYSMHSEK